MRCLCVLAFIFLSTVSGYSKNKQKQKDFVTDFFQKKNLLVKSIDYLETASKMYSLGIYSSDNAYAIVKPDDDGYTLIGYSLDKPFPQDADSIPPQLKALLSMPLRTRKSESEKIESVSPLCSAEWNQEWPYNTLCPTFPRGRALAGCVATAIAQAMYVHKHPLQGEGSITYLLPSELKQVTYDFSPNTYEWDSMLDSYSIKATERQRQAVALLCSDVGKAVRMDYGVDASGAYTEDAYEALRSYFGYSCSKLDFWNKSECDSQEQWNNKIYEELLAGRPIIYSATSTVDAGKDSNHCFLIDGCDMQGFVHVNWGWGGVGNGYFDITKLDVAPYEYSLNHKMIVGMQPRINEGDTIKRQYKPTVWDSPLSYSFGNVINKSRHDNIYLSNIVLRNNNSNKLTWECCVALFDDKWNFVETLSTPFTISLEWFKTCETPYTLYFRIPDRISNGNYYIALVSREEGRADWCRMKAQNGQKNNSIALSVVDDIIEINNHTFTGIATSTIDEDFTKTEYYTLMGIRLPTQPSNGLYIKRQNNKVSILFSKTSLRL